jgi:mannose-6-phosphate isomerase-like protein (cupin superfamily)
MSSDASAVFKIPSVPLIESPDGTMRDSVMVTSDTCGARQFSAGLFWVKPGTRGHEDSHAGQEELYYIFEGRGQVVIDGTPHRIEAGDVVFIADGRRHYLINDGDRTLGLFWALPKSWDQLPEIQRELGRWRAVQPGSGWGTA